MKVARITTAIALATALVTPLAVSAGEWAFDAPYWQQQLSKRVSSDQSLADSAGGHDFFGRPIVTGITPIDGLDAFDPTRASYLYANRANGPMQYAQGATGKTDTSASESTGEFGHDGAQLVEEIEAAKRKLNSAGFPQYNQ